MKQIIIYGAGNCGRKAVEVLFRQKRFVCRGFIDDTCAKNSVQEIPIIGSKRDLQELFNQGLKKAFVAIGNNNKRKELCEHLENIGFELVSLIDPSSFVSREAMIGKGVLIMPNVYVGHGSEIGNFTVCQANSIISHYVKIGTAVNISYGSIVSAYSSVGDFSRICIGAKIINKMVVGKSALVGAGSVVTKSVPSGVVTYGIPAKVIRKIDINSYDPNSEKESI